MNHNQKDSPLRFYWFNFPVLKMFPIISYCLILIFILIFILELFLSSSFFEVKNPILFAMGSLHPTVVFDHNEFFRTLSSSFLHGSYLHLFFNSLAMYFIGTLLERILGFGHFLFSYLLCCLGSGLFSIYLFDAANQSVGASGGIMGILAFLIIISFRIPKGVQRKQLHTQFAYYLIPSLIPIIPGVDYTAHWGGAICGFVLGLIYFLSWKSINFKSLQYILTLITIPALIYIGAASFKSFSKYSHYQFSKEVLPQSTLKEFHNLSHSQVDDLYKDYPKDPFILYKLAIRSMTQSKNELSATYLDKAINQDEILQHFYIPLLKLQILLLDHVVNTKLQKNIRTQLIKQKICSFPIDKISDSNQNYREEVNKICIN